MSKLTGLCVLLAASACASAQVTLSVVQANAATPVGEFYDFNSVSLGSVADAHFRLTNTGAQAVYLTRLALAGPTSPTPPYNAYFSLVCPLSPDLCGAAPTQQLPILINPTGTLDFIVQFEPFQLGAPSATMTIEAGNTIAVILAGTGVPGLTVLWNNQALSAGQTVTFTDVQVGSSQTIALLLANQTHGSLAIPSIPQLPAGDFQLAGSALTASTISAGASAELDMIFTPSTTGLHRATLTIGLLMYLVQGTGLAPPPPVFPAPSIQVSPSTIASAQQVSLAVNLASPSAAEGSGTVTLVFQSSVGSVGDDAAITFANGTRTAAFTVAKGASAGQFADGPSVSFGTGTTAGTLAFEVTLGNQTAQTNLVIPAAMIGIDAAVAARNVSCDAALLYCTATNIELQINGWDNTRSTSQLVFRFFDSSGKAISPGDITVAGASAFAQYFASSDLAGVFGLHALFPVTGDSNQVVAAQVQLSNSAGTVESARITF